MVKSQLKEQIVVVFGASSGIGRATALKLAKNGAKTIVAARDSQGIDSLVREIEKINPQSVVGMIADCSSNEDIQRVADMAITKWGRIDTWIQVASLFLFGKVLDTTEDEYQRIMDINFMGPVRASKIVIPHLIKSHGSFIVVTSVAARRSVINMGAYSASKHALDGFIESLRMELKHDGNDVSIVTILPGTVNTPIFDKTRNKMQGGYFKWVGPPPVYHPDVVANSIIYASTHRNIRDLVVGSGPWFMLLLQSLFPSLIDWAMVKFVPNLERTTLQKEKSDNFDKPIEGFDTVEGSYPGMTFKFSIYNFLVQHPILSKLGLR